MALKKSGIQLVAENYAQYIKQLRDINKAHKEAFNTGPQKAYEEAASKMSSSSKKVSQSVKTVTTSLKESWGELQKFRSGLEQVGTSANPIGALAARMKASGREVKQSVQETQSLIDNLRKTTSQSPGGGGTGGAGFGGLLSFLTNLPGKFAEAKSGAMGFASGLFKAAGPITALVAGLKTLSDVMNFFKTSGDIAQANETMAVSLQEVGTAVGYTSDQIKLGVELLKEQGITTSVAQKSLMRMARANISWSEAAKLAAIAQGSAVVAGMNSSEAFDRLVTGIQKMEPELLDELGITLQRERAYESFAKTIGKSSKALTQAEKQQAILNSIYEQSEVVIGVYDAAMETTGKQAGSLARHIEETQLSVGKALLPFRAISVEMQTNFWKGTKQAAKGLESLGSLLSGTMTIFKDFQNIMSMDLGEGIAFDEISSALEDTGLNQKEIIDITQQLIEKYGEADSITFEKLKQQLKDLGLSDKEAVEAAGRIKVALNDLKTDANLSEFQKQNQEAARGFALSVKGAAESLEIAGISANKVVGLFGVAISKSGEITLSFENVGRAIHEIAQGAVKEFVQLAANIHAAVETVKYEMVQIVIAAGFVKKLEFGKAVEALSEMGNATDLFAQKSQEAFGQYESYAQALFPTLFKSWDELNEKIEGSSEDLKLDTPAVPEVDTSEQQESLEALANAYKKLDDIQRKFAEDSSKLSDEVSQGLAKIREEAAKAEAQLAANRDKQLAKLDQDYAKQRSKLIQDAQREEKDRQKKHHRDMEYELKRFQLSQMQAQRRFQLSDRRLRAEGDILALMELRENHELEKKEAKENFDLDKKQKEEQAAEEDRSRQEELQRRLEELQENIQERRDEINASYQEELAALQVANAEKEEEFKRNMDERFNQLVENRNREIEELGRSLSEEKKITEEGMGEIAGAIAAIFESDAAADSLIKGWTERTTSAFGQLVADVEGQLEELEGAVEEMASAAEEASQSVSPNRTTPGTAPSRRGRPVGMRRGGEGVVTGPATFFVEPGVREHVKFTPLNQSGSMRHSGSLGLNLNVAGMPAGMNEQLERAVIEKAADLVIDNIEVSIERLRRRS